MQFFNLIALAVSLFMVAGTSASECTPGMSNFYASIMSQATHVAMWLIILCFEGVYDCTFNGEEIIVCNAQGVFVVSAVCSPGQCEFLDGGVYCTQKAIEDRAFYPTVDMECIVESKQEKCGNVAAIQLMFEKGSWLVNKIETLSS